MGDPVTAALIISGVSATAGIAQGQVAAKKQERAGELQQNTQMGQDRQARQQSAREQRIRRARILQAGENTGTSGSSQESGTLSGQQTIFAQAQGNQTSQQLSNIAIGNQMQSAADAASKANTFQAISGLAMQGASFAAANPDFFKKT